MKGKVCPTCGYRFEVNLPGVSTTNRPFFTHRTEGGTVYICSSECLDDYVDTIEATEAKNT